MDYSQLNDAEVAQKVWFWWNENIEHDNTLCAVSGGKVLYVKNSVWTAFDPCNNAEDAWPIILEHNIAVVPHRNIPSRTGATAFGVASKFTAEDKNPLRAAMIVFLMMQNANHA